MTIRAVPETMPLAPDASPPAESKPSAFPVLVCERRAARGRDARERRRPHCCLCCGTMRGASSSSAIPAASCRMPTVRSRRATTPRRGRSPASPRRPRRRNRTWSSMSATITTAKMPAPDGNPKCRGSPWGYGWDAWNADFFAPARDLLAAAPWVFVRGNHESCARAGQGWWRFLDPRPLVNGRDCNDAANDVRGDYSDPYAVPLSADTQLVVFDSSRVGVAPLAGDDPMYADLLRAIPARAGARARRGAQFFRRSPSDPRLRHRYHPAARGRLPGQRGAAIGARGGQRAAAVPGRDRRAARPDTIICSRQSASRPGSRRSSFPAMAAPGSTSRCRARCRRARRRRAMPSSRRSAHRRRSALSPCSATRARPPHGSVEAWDRDGRGH